MPDTGQSWQQHFTAQTAAARSVRAWVATRITHADASLLAGELFNAVLATRPDTIRMTVSTAGFRARITASGPVPLPLHALRGAGAHIIRALAHSCGTAPDDCGIWAELIQEQP